MPGSFCSIAAMLAAFLDLLASAEKSAAEEGRDIILAMLVVGLIFVGVALLGDLYQSGARKRHNRDSH
jgi:heme/copper-type cytochrome/quinol oxidase subunit 2